MDYKAEKAHHGRIVMRCIRNENFAFPLLKNNRVRPRSVIRAEKGQHAARLPFFHAVGVKTLGIRRVQPGIMNLFFRYPPLQ